MTSLGNKEVFAKNFSYYIEKSGKTQKEISEALNVATSTLNNWATAKKYPRIDAIEKLANYFGIKKSDLIEEKTIDAIHARPVETARLHFEMVEDVDFVSLFDDFRVLDEDDRQTVMHLANRLAKTKTEA